MKKLLISIIICFLLVGCGMNDLTQEQYRTAKEGFPNSEVYTVRTWYNDVDIIIKDASDDVHACYSEESEWKCYKLFDRIQLHFDEVNR